jgi:hypothetical protein
VKHTPSSAIIDGICVYCDKNSVRRDRHSLYSSCRESKLISRTILEDLHSYKYSSPESGEGIRDSFRV